MNTDPRDGINGLAAQVNAAHRGAGVINPSFPKNGLTSVPRNSEASPP